MLAGRLAIKDALPPIEMKPTVIPAPSPTPIPASMLLHFENELVAFDYLGGMKINLALRRL